MPILKLTKKYEHYPKYKDSGVEWFGELPADWGVGPVRSVLNERKDKNTNLVTDNILSVMKDVGVIRYADKGDVGNKSSDRPENYKIVHPGDIVLNSMNLVIGSVGQSKELGVTSSVYIIYYPKTEHISAEYYHYLFRDKSWQKTLGRLGRGIMELRESIKVQDLKIELVPIPPLETQKNIVVYLDEKTALVDAIIEKKRKQIELLREKRAAIINRAVTKGLDPKAKLIDSGIEWIGKIPEGWEVKKLKHVARVQASNVDKNTNEGDPEVLLCNYVDVYKHEYITADLKFMQSTATHDQVRKVGLVPGDVLITKDSESADDIGVPALVKDAIDDLVSGYHLYVIKPTRSQMIGDFLLRFLQSNYVHASFETSSNGVTRFGLGAQKVKDLQVLVPSVEEQERLARYINEKAEVADLAMEKIGVSIKQLQEFKSALISHVVTGKVKV